ncbi:MAG: hypothetical protein WBA97_31700 [Actinophytocola sp.]|uniref:NucA/NucB deoxyribonuclease domain-containing protein n=1 Tax=Actinophytocola sp. TaxID=1872138 RepID=UPI003C736199
MLLAAFIFWGESIDSQICDWAVRCPFLLAGTPAIAEEPVQPLPPSADSTLAAPPITTPPVPYTRAKAPAIAHACGPVVDGLQACVEPSTTTLSADELRQLHAKQRANRDVIPLPDWCYEYSDSWYYTRTEACLISSGDYIIRNVETGLPVGTMHFVVWFFSFTSIYQRNWQSQVELQPVTQSGLALGSTAEGAADCVGACTTLFHNFPPQAAPNGATVKGDAQFETTAVNPSAVGYGTTEFRIRFKSPCCPLSSPIYSRPPVARCDNATPGRGIGCVFSDYTLAVAYSLSPTYCCPEYARHVRDAHNSGLPGAYPSGVPLTRLTDPTLIESNRTVACKGSYVRPAGKSCDEYPMASTWQGARTGGGNPRSFSWCSIPQVPGGSGAAGYSVCMIVDTQNSAAGNALASFYSQNRVIDNDPFRVWIVA